MNSSVNRHRHALPYLLSTGVALMVTAVSEYLSGRVIMCRCGSIKLWHGQIWSSEASQHISDWYTFSHIIHGFAFYYLGKAVRRLSLFQTFVLALVIETGWEIIENSSIIIERYRSTTISLDYYGDSILNSGADILAMVVGFFLARKLPVWAIILLTLSMELGVGYLIRDNLSLNILMLLYPIPAVKQWQLGIAP